MNRRCARATALFAALIAATFMMRDSAGAADGPPLVRDYDENAVSALLRQPDPAAGVAEAKRLMARAGRQGDYAVISCQWRWLDAAKTAGHHGAVLELVAAAIEGAPNNTSAINVFQVARVRSLLALGRGEDALGHAKLYYNVCTMQSSGDAMSLIVDCLRVARPDDGATAHRFVREQVAGAAVTRDAPAGRTSVLESIRLPEAVRLDYSKRADRIRKLPPHNAPERLKLANYLLMADRPAEARQVLEETYQYVTNGEFLPPVTEGVARALRAEDGSVGRANAWVLAHR